MSTYILMRVTEYETGHTTGEELARGTKDECETVCDQLPTHAMTGADIKSVELIIGTEEQWEKSTHGVVARPS